MINFAIAAMMLAAEPVVAPALPGSPAEILNAEGIVIEAPEHGEINTPITMLVYGLPEVTTKEVDGKLTIESENWLPLATATINAPYGLDEGDDFTFSQEVTITRAAPMRWAWKCILTTKEPGDFILSVDWNLPQQLTNPLHRVVVSGDNPTPDLQIVVTIEPNSFKEGEQATGVVRLPHATRGSAAVRLKSSDITEAVVPLIITVPAGEQIATFDVIGVPDQTKDGDQNVTVTATSDGYLPGMCTLTVVDVDGDGPDPPPPPVENVTAVVVYETNNLSDLKWSQVVAGQWAEGIDGLTWQSVDDDAPIHNPDGSQIAAHIRDCIAKVKQGNLPEPHLFLIADDGTILESVLLPKSVDETKALIGRYLK